MRRNVMRIGLATALLALAACNGGVLGDGSSTATQPPATTQTAPGMNSSLRLGGVVGGVVNGLTNTVGGVLSPVVGVVFGLTTNGSCVMADSLVLDVGPAGGSVTLGANVLSVPAGAVTSMTHIVALPHGGATMSVQFYPEGLVFPSNATPSLTLATDCITSLFNQSSTHIVYTDDAGNVREQKAVTNRTSHTVSTILNHFSRYAIAW